MSKRSAFLRRERDFYATPLAPVKALLPHLDGATAFCEPCCGDGTLIRHLEAGGHVCALALDLEPTGDACRYAATSDARALIGEHLEGCDYIITNPPWPAARGRGAPTMDLIRHLATLRPTWMLLSADFAHNTYAREVLRYCQKIVSIGRVRWIPDSPHVGKDNCAWYLFDRKTLGPPVFYMRMKVF